MKIVPRSDQKPFLIVLLIVYLVFIGMLFWGTWVNFWIDSWLDTLVPLLLGLILINHSLGSAIFYFGRSLYLDKHGCTMTFLGYKKVIKWDEFQSKMYKPEVPTGTKYDRYLCHGVFFAVKPLPDKVQKVQKVEYVKDYCMFHTFSSFYVLFPYRKPSVDPFVDGDEFLGLMKEWGVEIEGLEQSK